MRSSAAVYPQAGAAETSAAPSSSTPRAQAVAAQASCPRSSSHFVDAARVLPDPSALVRRMEERYLDGLPSQLVLRTGPSRSGGIEGILTRGVHGPGVVHVGLITSG